MSTTRAPLLSVAKVLNGFAFKSKEYVDSGIRVMRITNVQKGQVKDDNPKFIEASRDKDFSRYMLEPGDILISLTGNVGRVGVVDKNLLPAALNQRVGAIKIHSDRVEPRYLFHILNSDVFEKAAIQSSKGIAQLNLSSKWVEKYEIPLPPLAEQKRIAAILDAADKLRAKRREAIAQLDTLLQSTFLDMFGDPVTNPMGWDVYEIGSIGSVVTGNTPSRKETAYYANEADAAIEWIKSDNIEIERVYLTKAKEFLSEKGVGVARTVPAGSILVTCIAGSPASIGNSSIADRDVSMNQQINAFVPGKNINSFYFYGLSVVGKRMIQKASTNSMKGMVSKSAFSAIEIPVPPLKNQKNYQTVFENIFQQKSTGHQHQEDLDLLFESLQQRAFNGTL